MSKKYLNPEYFLIIKVQNHVFVLHLYFLYTIIFVWCVRSWSLSICTANTASSFQEKHVKLRQNQLRKKCGSSTKFKNKCKLNGLLWYLYRNSIISCLWFTNRGQLHRVQFYRVKLHRTSQYQTQLHSSHYKWKTSQPTSLMLKPSCRDVQGTLLYLTLWILHDHRIKHTKPHNLHKKLQWKYVLKGSWITLNYIEGVVFPGHISYSFQAFTLTALSLLCQGLCVTQASQYNITGLV